MARRAGEALSSGRGCMSYKLKLFETDTKAPRVANGASSISLSFYQPRFPSKAKRS
jgi:hypothetical protein